MTPVRLEPAAPRSRVKHSTTKPLRSQKRRHVSFFQDEIHIHAYSVLIQKRGIDLAARSSINPSLENATIIELFIDGCLFVPLWIDGFLFVPLGDAPNGTKRQPPMNNDLNNIQMNSYQTYSLSGHNISHNTIMGSNTS